jgi:ABC-type transport system involved in multi-copper enzyme maturation permease subunit
MRILKDISLTSIGLFSLLLTFGLFLGALPKEMETKTLYPLLAKPLSRSHYLWGKYLGLLSLIFLNLFIIAVELFIIVKLMGGVWQWSIFQAIFLNFMECAVVAALLLLLSIQVTIPVNLSLTSLLYVAGNMSSTYVKFLEDTGVGHPMSLFLRIFKLLFPNFDFFHINNAIIYDYMISPQYVFFTALYGIMYVLLFMLLADLLFERKDL